MNILLADNCVILDADLMRAFDRRGAEGLDTADNSMNTDEITGLA